ncbi:hypothetical protein JST97_13080 [bacterium]|nr:hypothetical protein [bacterium]
MEISASRLPPIASLRPLTAARCAQVPANELKRHHKYYNDVLATVDFLRAERYRLPPDPIRQATEPDPEDDEATALQKSEYARLHTSLAREMTRGSRQLDQLGPGEHILSDSVHVHIQAQRIVTYRSDGSIRHADLSSQSLVEVSPSGVPEVISRRGSTMYSGSQALPLPPQKPPPQVQSIADHFSLTVAGQCIQVQCRSLPSGLIEIDLGQVRLQISFAQMTPTRQSLEKLAYNYLAALQHKVPSERLARSYHVTPTPQAAPKISGELKPRPVPPPAQPESAPKDGIAPSPKKVSAKVESQAKELKVELKPKPPSPPLRIQLVSGAKLSTTRARLRKARKLAARATKYDPHPATRTVKEQVALRLAILSEEELESFEHSIQINPAGLPPRKGWLNEEWLYEKADEDPLLLHILGLLS